MAVGQRAGARTRAGGDARGDHQVGRAATGAPEPDVRRVDTSRGTAEVLAEIPDQPLAVLVLGHGAGGSVTAPDLAAVAAAAVRAGLAVVRVTQPYRVAGRRAPAPAAHLD